MIRPQVNRITANIEDLSIYLRSTKKFGKSTLFRDVIIEKYGDPTKGLLVSCGAERGTKLLDNVNTLHISSYKEAVELKDWLIQQKNKEHDIRIVAFDTGDELIPMFEKETVRLYNVENPSKKVKSIKAAYGGYQNGELETGKLVKKYMDELQEAGFGVWCIAHTKFKSIKEKGTLEEDGYMQLTSNLIAPYESAFGDIFDVTLTGVIDRQIEEKKDGDTVKRYVTDEVRKLYFRGTTMIDAGGRFAADAVPEYLVFDKPNMAKDFIKTVEEGMEKSKTLLNSEPTSVVVPTMSSQCSDDTIKNEETNAVDKSNILDDIRVKFKSADTETKKVIKGILNEKGSGKLDENLPNEVIDEILSLL